MEIIIFRFIRIRFFNEKGQVILRNFAITAFLFLIPASIILMYSGCARDAARVMSSSFPRSETLYVGGFQWGAPGDFNPLSLRPSFPITGNVSLVYETLFGFNAQSSSLTPILGKRYEFSNSVLTVELNESARWNDGEPLSAADIIYTFYFHRRYPTSLSSHWRFIDTVYAQGNLIRFGMNTALRNPLVMRDIIASTQILPKHVFERLEMEAIREVETSDAEVILARIRRNRMSENAVSSGPYRIHSYTQHLIALERDDNYWGNEAVHAGRLPAPRFIVHPIYASNDDFNSALAAGYLDMSQTFFAQTPIARSDTCDLENWEGSLYVPGAITALLVNFAEPTQHFSPNPVLRNAEFRRALGWAINYEQIRQAVLGGNVPEIHPGFIVNDGAEKKFYNEEDARSYGVRYNLDYARQILKNAGFDWDGDGNLLCPASNSVEDVSVTLPRGWTDWEQAASIIAVNFANLGVSAQVNLVGDREYWHNLSMGFFDLIMHTPRSEQSASLPWSRFDAVLNSRDLVPLGVATWSNQGRFESEEISRLLDMIPPLRDEAQIREAYRELNRLFMAKMPVIPIMYRPRQFNQFSTRFWEITDSSESPYVFSRDLITAGGVKGLWGIAARDR